MHVFDINTPSGTIPSLRAAFSLRAFYTYPSGWFILQALHRASGFHHYMVA